MKLTNATLTVLLVLASLNFDRSRCNIPDSDMMSWERNEVVNNSASTYKELDIAERVQLDSQARRIIQQSGHRDTIPAGTSSSRDSLKRTVLGSEYILHIDVDSPESQPGDYIFFHYVMRTADTILANTLELGQENYIQHPGDTVDIMEIDEVTDVIRTLSVGDSATVSVRIDTFSAKPPGLENVDEIYFNITITNIIDEATFIENKQREQAEVEARRQAIIERAPEMQAFADSIRMAYLAGELLNLQQTDSGLQYVIHEPGQGPPVEPGQMLDVHYVGMLTDGTIFDQSFRRGQPINFPIGVGAVIPGWDEGLLLLNNGTHATFFIPAELGYGEVEQGPIPANSDLIFYVELEFNE